MKKVFVLLVSIVFVALLVGCRSKVTDKQITLNMFGSTRNGTYTGEVEKDVPDGKGKFTTKNSAGKTWYYDGEFKNGVFEGKGIQEWPADKLKYEGTYKNDWLVSGKEYKDNTLVYEGAFGFEGTYTFRDGQGKAYNMANGKSYVSFDGTWKHGLPVVGKEFDPTGKQIYEGKYVNGHRGIGTVGLNQDASYADWVYKVTSVDVQNVIGNNQAKGIYVILHTDFTNNNNAPRMVGQDVWLIDSHAREYRLDTEATLALKQKYTYMGDYNKDWYLSAVNPSLTAHDIQLAFDVPKDATNLAFVLQNDGRITPIIVKDKLQ